MKKNKMLITVLLIVFGLMNGCNKSSDVKDSAQTTLTTADSIKNREWWGTFAYTNSKPEYYSVEFNEDSSLLWEQYSGDTKGHWTVIGNKLTITFEGNDEKITADISGNILTNFSDNTSKSEITVGEKIENPDFSIDNLDWEGPFGKDFQIEVKTTSDKQVEIYSNEFSYQRFYTRRAHSGVFRAGNPAGSLQLFAIIISDHELVGTINSEPFRIPISN